MPFTISHPAIVLPLKQLWPRWFSLSGLISGAMAPDLLYFLMLQTTYRGVSHSWLGLIVFCLPAGILFAYCFHRFFKYHAIYNLPRPFDIRLSGLADQRFRIDSFGGVAKLAVSVLIGALTHFLWDSFTHDTGEIAQIFPILKESFTVYGYSRPLCRFIQHFSTITGAIMMLIYFLKGTLLPPPTVDDSIRTGGSKFLFWLMGGVAAILFAGFVVLCFAIVSDLRLGAGTYSHSIKTSFGLAGWAGFFYFVCIYSVVSNYRRRSHSEAESDEI